MKMMHVDKKLISKLIFNWLSAQEFGNPNPSFFSTIQFSKKVIWTDARKSLTVGVAEKLTIEFFHHPHTPDQCLNLQTRILSRLTRIPSTRQAGRQADMLVKLFLVKP